MIIKVKLSDPELRHVTETINILNDIVERIRPGNEEEYQQVIRLLFALTKGFTQ